MTAAAPAATITTAPAAAKASAAAVKACAELAEGVRRLCQGRFPLEGIRAREGSPRVVDREGWRQLGEAGVFNLCLAGEAGGVGLGLAEAALVFEELGRALVPGPLVAYHLAAGLVDGVDGVPERRVQGQTNHLLGRLLVVLARLGP